MFNFLKIMFGNLGDKKETIVDAVYSITLRGEHHGEPLLRCLRGETSPGQAAAAADKFAFPGMRLPPICLRDQTALAPKFLTMSSRHFEEEVNCPDSDSDIPRAFTSA